MRGSSIAIKACNGCVREEFPDLCFNEFRADAFMNDVSFVTVGTRSWNGRCVATNVALQYVLVDMKREWHEAARTDCRPAAVSAECRTGAAAAVVKKECLLLAFKRDCNAGEERVG